MTAALIVALSTRNVESATAVASQHPSGAHLQMLFSSMGHARLVSALTVMGSTMRSSVAMHAMDMVPVSQSQASVCARNLTLGILARTPTVQMTALVRASATLTQGNVLAIHPPSSTLGQAVSSWIALLAVTNRMVSVTGMMASAYARWVTLVRNANSLLGAPLVLSTLQKPTGGQFGTNPAGLHAHKAS